MRDFGEDEALALMRAQNEPPETVVRLVRGEVDGEPTDVPGAYRVERVDEQALAEGASGRRAARRSSPALAVGSRDGERILDSCAAPGGKATMLARRGHRRRAERGSRARARGERAAARRDERPRRARRRDDAAAGARRLRPRARRRAVLGARRARDAAPTCAGARGRCRSSSSRCCAAAAERVRPGGTIVYSVCTLNADENEAVVDASGLELDATLGDEWPQFRHPRRPEFLLTLPHVHGTSGFFIARLSALESRPWRGATGSARSRSSRRSTRRTSRTSATQIDVLLRAGARIFHFDVGDGHFVPPVTIGPIVLQSIAPLDPRRTAA